MQWIGFFDEESAIHHYTVCVTSMVAPGQSCDIHSGTNIYTGNDVTLTNLNLKPLEKYFVQVTACNNVNLCSKGTSKPFTIDISPPVVTSNISLTTYSSLKPNTQFDRSYISFSWKMEDAESPMFQYIISLDSHHDGEIPVSDLKLGDITSTTIALSNHLKDGSLYYAEIIGCNAALLCTVSKSEGILVDSSIPLLGAFVDPMYWANTPAGANLDLAWNYFTDPHSGVAKYHIMISSAYNGFDLSNGIITVSHNYTSTTQRLVVFLPGYKLEANSRVYLSIWAENGVGLTSDAAKASVFSIVSCDRFRSIAD